MRRKDREVTDLQKLREIMDRCDCFRVGFCDAGEVYIVPLNFGYTEENGTFTLYCHGAKAGRKAELIEKAPRVGFEMDTSHQLQEADTACNHSYLFQSIIGNGTICFVEDAEEKKRALNLIMAHTTGKGDWEYPENMLNATGVYKLTVDSLCGKEHL